MTATLTAEQAREIVKRGAAALDEIAPGWDSHVDPATFDLADGQYCILGQAARFVLEAVGADTHADYDGVEEDRFDYGTVMDYVGQDFCIAPEDYGFIADSGDAEDWAMLQCAWQELLAERAPVPA